MGGSIPPLLTRKKRKYKDMFLKNLFINWLKPFIKIIKSELSKINSPILGDIKTGIQNADHNGWIRLDGRAKVMLNQKQQSNATALGIGANIPNATDCQLTQNGTALGSVSGSNTKNIAQNQLPNISPTITIGSGGVHEHPIAVSTDNFGWANNAPKVFKRSMSGFSDERDIATSDRGVTGYETTGIIGNSGSHSHSAISSSINGGVTQQAFDVRGKQLSINAFIFLGI